MAALDRSKGPKPQGADLGHLKFLYLALHFAIYSPAIPLIETDVRFHSAPLTDSIRFCALLARP